MAVGVEKMSDQTVSNVGAAEATLTDSDYEAEHGLTPTAQAALLMRRYIHEYSPPDFAFGGFPLLAHKNGASQPERHVPEGDQAGTLPAGWDGLRAAEYVRCVPRSRRSRRRDPHPPGAASQQFSHPLVQITGSSVVVDTLALHDRPDPLIFNAARLSAARALEMAGKTNADIDLFELFDAYSIYATLTLEATGFAKPGTGWQLTNDGTLELDGKLPILTFGGCKARGNPGGATGLYQAVEAAMQLRGDAGTNQVENAQTALIQALGGPASTAASHVLERNQLINHVRRDGFEYSKRLNYHYRI